MNSKLLLFAILGLIVLVVAVFVYLPIGNNGPVAPSPGGGSEEYVTPAEVPSPYVTPASGKIWTIEFKDGVYTPKEITVKKGDSVTWINRDAEPTWPASALHPTHGVYPDPENGACPEIGGSAFDACRGLKQGESWTFQFNHAGSWRFHDHLKPNANGTIKVEE